MNTTRTAAAVLGLLSVAACGATGKAASPAAAATPAGTQAQGFRAPGASGLLAAIDGTTLQVQDTSSQTAVTYSAATTFTQTVPATAADLAVGLCAMVRSVDPGATSPTSPTSPSATPTRPTALTATSVTLSRPVNGSCTPALGGPGGGPGRFQGTPPPGAPDRIRPSGAPGSGRRFGGGFGSGAVGMVTQVHGGTFVLASTRPAGRDSTAAPTTTDVTVTVTSTTTWTLEKKTTAAALRTGTCVTARGRADSSGTVAATSISIRPASGGTCTGGFGPRNG